MKNLFITTAVLAASLTALAADKPDDSKAIQGVWKPTTAVLAGQPLPPPSIQGITLKLKDDCYEVTVEGQAAPDQGTWKLHTATEPKSMSITSTNGPNNGKTFPAIYEVKGDTLRICYDLSGASPPKTFESVPGTKFFLVTYKRQKQ
jgi:uncharacterized protein (TIGR03067 family)